LNSLAGPLGAKFERAEFESAEFERAELDRIEGGTARVAAGSAPLRR
jgi:hypothetical protein